MPPRADHPSDQNGQSRALHEPWVHPILGPLASRVVMSAMTRNFAGPGHTATDAMAAYYAARAHHGVGLVLTESLPVTAGGDGFPRAPRMETAEQIASWTPVVDAVHAAGAPILAQLIHCGRIAHTDFSDGLQPVSSTDRVAAGIIRHNGKPYSTPRRLEASELPAVYEMFRHAATAALSTGFDAIELHFAHGYLADQFLDARVNDRTDSYGGSVANRCRFALELAELILGECGGERVMIRISPSRWMDGLYDWPDLPEMVAYLIPAFESIGLRMLDVSCARAEYAETSGRVIRRVRPLWPHFLIGGASLAPAEAQSELDAGWLDMVTYGRLLIANPDLVDRLREGRELRVYDRALLDRLE